MRFICFICLQVFHWQKNEGKSPRVNLSGILPSDTLFSLDVINYALSPRHSTDELAFACWKNNSSQSGRVPNLSWEVTDGSPQHAPLGGLRGPQMWQACHCDSFFNIHFSVSQPFPPKKSYVWPSFQTIIINISILFKISIYFHRGKDPKLQSQVMTRPTQKCRSNEWGNETMWSAHMQGDAQPQRSWLVSHFTKHHANPFVAEELVTLSVILQKKQHQVFLGSALIWHINHTQLKSWTLGFSSREISSVPFWLMSLKFQLLHYKKVLLIAPFQWRAAGTWTVQSKPAPLQNYHSNEV